jgi:hypothetical protein
VEENRTFKSELQISIGAEHFLFTPHVKWRPVIASNHRAQQQKRVELIFCISCLREVRMSGRSRKEI